MPNGLSQDLKPLFFEEYKSKCKQLEKITQDKRDLIGKDNQAQTTIQSVD